MRLRLLHALLVALAALSFSLVASAQPADATEAIRERVDQLRYAGTDDPGAHVVRGSSIVAADGVARYYEAEQFQPRWRDPAQLDQLIAAIADMQNDGLDPVDYHVVALQSFRSDMRGGKALPAPEQADLEVVATDAMMLALYHLYFGKVDPEKLSSQWNFSTRPLDVEAGFERFRNAIAAGEIRQAFDRARPQSTWYRRAREQLKEYRALQAAGGWSALAGGPTMKLGESDPRVPALRYRLKVTRDMPGDLQPPTPPYDTVFDADLDAAVKRFQDRHGLTPDGAVGPGTLAALNVPVAARIDQIRINLERARWVMHELKGDFVLVDVAGFYVSYYRNDEPIWTSKVIVGRPYRETPIFKSLITYVVFNPTWTIPPGILVKDKLPVIRKDPGYLKRNNIRVLDASGREVNPYSVNWSRYGAGNLPPYTLRQDPGDENALGLVKIMFPNKYSVYLHDTPTKNLFDKDERTFSSGCIRVQKAFELAELVLNDPERWNQKTMAEVVATGEMKTVNLARPVPVLLLYWTAQPTPDGQIIFRNDIYGRDPPLLAALDADFQRPAKR
ncbi:MAG: murein L,D-transpeptidase [Gammaproteobacteria bacterium]|nr:murein L,D-transpeptidase [Gammaproteobacteria bacterium]